MTQDVDIRGYITEEFFLGTDGYPVKSAYGFARAEAVRDSTGNMLEERYYGTDGKPIRRSNKLRPKEELRSVLGQWRPLILQGIHSNHTLENLEKSGFATVNQQFDTKGHVIGQSFWDVDGSPIAGFDGFIRIDVDYDQFGLPFKLTTVLPDSSHNAIQLRISYSPRYDVERVVFTDSNGSLITSRFGFAEMHFLYDEKYQQSGIEYLDTEGNLVEWK